MFNIIEGIIKGKDSKYYPMYLKFKEEFQLRYSSKPKMAIHRIAMNRVATFLLKEIYLIWSGKK